MHAGAQAVTTVFVVLVAKLPLQPEPEQEMIRFARAGLVAANAANANPAAMRVVRRLSILLSFPAKAI
jgi:hypothetical protein